MGLKNTQQLFFNYNSTAKIRFKKSNCFEHPEKPYIYRIKTGRLDFVVAKSAVIIGKEHVFIPNEIYRSILNKFYKNIANGTQG